MGGTGVASVSSASVSGRITTDGTGAFFEFPQPVSSNGRHRTSAAIVTGNGGCNFLFCIMMFCLVCQPRGTICGTDSGKYLHRLFLTV
ncbi:hypothetical protein AAGN62_004668 [Escherichia coli]